MAITGDEEGLSTAIRSFIRYFNDIKPYHTKILEVLEQYNFEDALEVIMRENLLSDYTLANDPLCSPVEVGTEFDEGFTFTTNYTVVGYDDVADEVWVNGDVTGDITAGDYVFLNASATGLRPINVEVISLTYNGGDDRTEIEIGIDVQTGVNDDFTRVGTEYCNLFTTIVGGFGEVFDDDKIIVQAPIVSDDGDSTVVVSGNYSYDQRWQIRSIPNTTSVLIEGDITDVIDPDPDGVPTDGKHAFFRITPRRTYPLVSCTANSFTVEGDHASEILANKEMEVLGTGPNDGRYSIISATYSGVDDETTILVSSSQTIDPTYCDGVACVARSTRNTGFYAVSSAVFNGVNTVITVDPSTPFALTDTTEAGEHGSLLVRTGLTPRRIVTLSGERTRLDKQITLPNTFEDSLRPGDFAGGDYDFDVTKAGPDWNAIPTEITLTEDIDYVVKRTTYDADLDQTTICLVGDLPPTVVGADLELRGHFGSAGLDGEADTNDPRATHLYAAFAENLLVELLPGVPLSPTPTPASTPTPTPTTSFTPTVTPSAGTSPTPTPTSTVTPSPTGSVTPTVTATVTPTQTVTPTSTPGATATPTPTASATPSVTPTQTPPATATPTPTPTVTTTVTPSVTPSNTPPVTPTATVTPTNSPPVTPTATVTPTSTPAPSVTPSVTASVTPSNTPPVTPTATVTPSPSAVPSPLVINLTMGKDVGATPVDVGFSDNTVGSAWTDQGIMSTVNVLGETIAKITCNQVNGTNATGGFSLYWAADPGSTAWVNSITISSAFGNEVFTPSDGDFLVIGGGTHWIWTNSFTPNSWSVTDANVNNVRTITFTFNSLP